MIHRDTLAAKTIKKRLQEQLINYKSSAVNTRLFRELCKDMDADHTNLLYHTQVRWLSKGNMLSRVFELREEIRLFVYAQNKVDL